METIDENSVVLNWDDDYEIMNPGGDTTLTTYAVNNNIEFVNLKRFVNDLIFKTKCPNSAFESFSIAMKHYSRRWYEFVSFRINLLYTKLKSLLYNKLNCSIKDIKYFDANSIFDRSKNNNSTKKGIKKLNNNQILVYCCIWNCIYCIMHKRKDLKCGLDCKIGYKSNILSKDNNIFVIDSNKICNLLKAYIIDQLAQTFYDLSMYSLNSQNEMMFSKLIKLINLCLILPYVTNDEERLGKNIIFQL